MSRDDLTSAPSGPAGGATPDDDLNNRLFFRLVQSANIYERQVLRELDISTIQGAVLGALSRDRAHGIAFSVLVDYLAVSRQNLDAVLKRLERLGYVERIESAADRRVRMVRLTPAGAAFWDDLFRRCLVFYRQATERLSEDERRALSDMLGVLRTGLRETRTPAARAATEAAGGAARPRRRSGG